MGSSSQPQNRPGVKHVVLDVVLVGMAGFVVVMVDVVVVLSLQPNHPGVRHVVVVVVEVSVVVAVPVVVSSRHPHQPGVLQVSVRVRVFDVDDDDVEDVMGSVPLLSYIFQLPQSRHSGVNLHSGTVSYFMITS